MLKEYAVGFLLTEGVINDPDGIESIQIEKNKVSIITLSAEKIIFSKKTILSGCSGTLSAIDYSRLPSAPKGDIFTFARIHEAVSKLKSAGGEKNSGEIQYAGLFNAEKTISVAGDIGRDNAFDKVIGDATLKKNRKENCFAVVDGKISSEIIRKCLFAQIPVIVSTGPATSLAFDIALERDITLIGLVNFSDMTIYTGSKRIKAKENR
jgi:FdhD protein